MLILFQGKFIFDDVPGAMEQAEEKARAAVVVIGLGVTAILLLERA